MTFRKLLALAGVASLLITSPAMAGVEVLGYGNSRAEAAANANIAAQEASAQRFGGKRNCYTPVRPQDCRSDSGGWICAAHVANHEGSCG